MRRHWWVGSRVVLAMVLGAAVWCPPDVALGQLPIGLPDFPRKVRRSLPALRPDQEIRVGALKLHPSYETSVTYDDNVRLSNTNKKGDVFFTQRPGLIGEVRLGDHRLEAGYGVELLTFVKDHEENAVNHLAHALLELNFNDLHLTASEAMEEATNRLLSENSVRDRAFLNTVSVGSRYDRPHWALESSWTHNTVKHRATQFRPNDYGEDVLSVLGGYKAAPKLLVLLEPTVGLINYDRNTTNADQPYWRLMTGFRTESIDRLISSVKVGYQHRTLTDVGGQGSHRNYSGLVANMETTYKLNSSDNATLVYSRTVWPSTHTNNNWYREDRIGLSLRKALGQKWSVIPAVAWQMNAYPETSTVGGVTKKRRDNFATAGVGLRYDIQEWLSTGIAYDFRSRHSNFSTFNYNDNQFSMDLTVAF